MRLDFLVPTRGLIGFRTEFLTETRGSGILHSVFEQCFRAGPTAWGTMPSTLAASERDVLALAEQLVDEQTAGDLEGLGRVTLEDYGDLCSARELQVGPTFVQSQALGGADADVIYDGTLLDLKATGQDSVVGRREVWQLAGYLLADTADDYGVQFVEFGAVRRRTRVAWSAQQLLDELSGSLAPPLQELRAEFAEMLAVVREGRELGELRLRERRPAASLRTRAGGAR